MPERRPNRVQKLLAGGVVGILALLLIVWLGSTIFRAARKQQIGVGIISRAIEEPIRMIVQNAGGEGSIVIEKVRNSKESNFGYNALTDEYENLVEAGVIDSPFCPNVHVKDKVLGVKDLEGACRYLEFGSLPLPPEVKDFHRAKVAEREKAEGRKMDYNVVVEDFWAFSKGKIIGA